MHIQRAKSHQLFRTHKNTNNGNYHKAHFFKKLYPHMVGFPKLKLPETVNGDHVRFPCIVPFNKTGIKDVAFEVGWTIDDVPITDPRNGQPVETILKGDDRTAYLNADFLYNHLGKTLKCTVRSYNINTPLLKSNVRPSAGYFVGINNFNTFKDLIKARVSKSVVIVDEKGPEQEITLESTIPIPCHANNPTQCKLSVELKASNNPNDISTSSCIYDLKYDLITGKYKTTIKVKATRDFVKDNDKVHELAFRPIFSTNHDKRSREWIQVNERSVICYVHRSYDVYKVGDFTMYKSKSREFEVQIRNWECGGPYHPCICAVVAREGNDVIQIDICAKRENEPVAPQFKVLSKSPLDGTSINRDPTGKNFYTNITTNITYYTIEDVSIHLEIQWIEIL
ncbi:hypothetical protein KUTeg_021636 [Tegillarca granosa]|uniref:Uncharacterized protein n=1 Tax=Tegillarca granosa TaxID=220873 RepID=A0ABQ9E990_TEGGR|nr:hypothetical protein KUTeg_021636 [Tegillarca granosa]